MTNNANTEQDLEKQEDVKADRTRSLLKWAIVLSVVALLAIVGVAIPLALKVLPGDDNERNISSSANMERTDGFKPLEPSQQTTLPPGPTPVDPAPTPVDPALASASPTVFTTVITKVPTSVPTKSPAPTDDRPSTTPTIAPTTLEPTPSPSDLASAAPTKSPAPSVAPIDPSYAFKLRLFWQRGFYWQESFSEVWHCVECTKCLEYGAGDGLEHGCEEYPESDSSYCQEGDMFWIMGCDDRGSQFNVLENPGSGHQIRLDDTNICIGRGAPAAETGEWKSRLMRAVKCNTNDRDQLWAPFPSLSKFELRPFEHAGRTEDDAECVSQLHHPKNGEVISMHGCKLSRIYETRYWEQY